MSFTVIVGSRNRRSATTGQDITAVEKIINHTRAMNPDTVFVSVACDYGIGAVVKDICNQRGLPFVEVSIHPSNVERSRLNEFYIARDFTLYNIGTVFHMFVREDRKGTNEHLVQLLADNPKLAIGRIYGEGGDLIEEHDYYLEYERQKERDKQAVAEVQALTEQVRQRQGDKNSGVEASGL